MATFYADSTGAYVPARSGTGTISVPFSYTPAAPFGGLGDILILCKLPAYSTLLGFWLEIPDLDSGATAVRLKLGTKSSDAQFIASHNPTGATTVRISSYEATDTVLLEKLPFRALDTDIGDVTAEDDLRLTVITAAITTLITTKPIRGFAQYVCNEAAAMAEVPVAVP